MKPDIWSSLFASRNRRPSLSDGAIFGGSAMKNNIAFVSRALLALLLSMALPSVASDSQPTDSDQKSPGASALLEFRVKALEEKVVELGATVKALDDRVLELEAGPLHQRLDSPDKLRIYHERYAVLNRLQDEGERSTYAP